MSIQRNSSNLHDDATGLLTGYVNPVTGKEIALDAAEIQALVAGAGDLTDLTAPGLLSGVTYDASNRAVQWTIDGVTYTANYSGTGIIVAGTDGTITNISIDPAQRITSVATA